MTAQDMDNEETIDRRNAIKKGIAAGAAAGIVWTAPKVEGLTLRPNYASAGSTSTSCTFNIAATGDASLFEQTQDICSGKGRIYLQIRKDFINNPRNIAIQTQTFNGDANFPASAAVNPADYLPGGIPGAGGAAYNFNGILNGNGPVTVNIPYLCA